MPEVKAHPPGAFCWVELNTSDVDAAKKFYCGLFDWQAHDEAAGPDMVYTTFKHGGHEVGAMSAMQAEHKAQGVPPHWVSYVAVENADIAAKQAVELGGKLLAGPFDVMDAGRMAVMQDPQGASFCVWQANASVGIGLVGEPGSFGWDELWTTDCGAAAAFYTSLFGWTAKDSSVDDSGGGYTEWQLGGQSIGGMMKIRPDMGPVPPNWLPYFMVADCNASADKAVAAGAKLIVPPMDIPDVGRFTVIADPQGAMFAIIMLFDQAD